MVAALAVLVIMPIENIAVQAVMMVVLVSVNGRCLAKNIDIGLILGDLFRVSLTADVLI